MNKEALLQQLLLKFEKAGFSKYKQYNRFEYVDRSASAVTIRRQKGTTAAVPYKKLLYAISLYHEDPALYDAGPGRLHKAGISHVSSPVHSILHLAEKMAYVKSIQ